MIRLKESGNSDFLQRGGSANPSLKDSNPAKRGTVPAGLRLNRFGVLWLLFALLLIPVICSPPIQAKIYVDVDNPNLAKIPIAVPDFVSEGQGPVNGSALAGIIRNDLSLTGLFQIVDAVPPTPWAANGDPHFSAWSQTGAQMLASGRLILRGNEISVETRLYDLALKEQLLGKRFAGDPRDLRHIAHKIADRVLKQLTGTEGCFSSKIAFAADSQSREIYSMDFDGHDLRQITRTGTINLSPAWLPDNSGVVYTSYMNRNPDLWAMDFATLRPRVVSARPGLNASGRYSPDGRMIALSLSFNGIPKIFLITPEGHIIKRLTEGLGNDISPAWSPDGSTVAFVSDQSGSPQIYTLPANGGRASRITFGSNYNTDPDWSPRGDLLAFSSRIDGRFQICTMRPDGKDLKVLTAHGSNEDPTWSPNGRMIAFTSNRSGKRLIYIMDVRGEIQVPVSPITGKAPAWSGNSR
jgi:TolB protein